MGKIYHTAHAKVDVGKILDVHSFDLQKKLEIDPSFLEENAHVHDSLIGSIVIEEPRPVNLDKFRNWMQQLLLNRGADILRMKGILNAYGLENQFIFQGVRMLSTTATGRPWMPGEKKLNQIVFIGRNLDRAELFAAFERCLTDGYHMPLS
jgi:G3E family GTPase